MHIHILGICGTFMGGLARIASAAGHHVSGSDANVYPPMSDQLAAAGIPVSQDDDPGQLDPVPDWVVIGNAMSRGNPVVEAVLARGLPYTSGPQWLAENLLRDRWVLAVAGTHGKTSTASMLAWILEDAGLDPGYLIGGVPVNFGESARRGGAPFFVIEADEYDTAFFDKRSKFVHYRPRTLILNNLEFDHADIFDDLGMIQRQFHHLVRTVPANGLIIAPGDDENLNSALEMGCWTPLEHFGDDRGWQAVPLSGDGSRFEVAFGGESQGVAEWSLSGVHNMQNALAAIAAARHAGVPGHIGVAALCRFHGIKRRMELSGEAGGVVVLDDFAHHPTAIRATLAGLRARVGEGRIIAIVDPRSNTMRMGVHRAQLPDALLAADEVVVHAAADLKWSPHEVFAGFPKPLFIERDVAAIVERCLERGRPGDRILVMSNGGFGGIHEKLLTALGRRHETA